MGLSGFWLSVSAAQATNMMHASKQASCNNSYWKDNTWLLSRTPFNSKVHDWGGLRFVEGKSHKSCHMSIVSDVKVV